jgi:hypothetical protein
VTPTGTGTGRGWLLCPSSVPAADGRGLRPCVFCVLSAHGPPPPPQLQVQKYKYMPRHLGRCPILWSLVVGSRHRHHITYIACSYVAPPTGPIQRPNKPLGGMSNTNAMKQLQGTKHENWPVCDPRAAPPGEYGLKSGKNGHLARANGAIDGPYCSPTWPSMFGRRCEPLAGRGGGFGGGAAPAPTRGAWGASSNCGKAGCWLFRGL